MKKLTTSTSIQKKILLITISFLFAMCLIISSISFYIFQRYLQNSLLQSTETSLQLLTDNINNNMNNIYQLVRFCQTNKNITNYIENSSSNNPVLSVSTYDRITEEYNNNPSSNYIPRLAIITKQNFLQIVNTSYSSTTNLAAEVPLLPYFEKLLFDSTYNFSTGIINDPFYRTERLIIPVIRPISSYNDLEKMGYLFIEISIDLFLLPLSRYHTAEDSFLYLTLDNKTYLYENNNFILLDFSYDDLLNSQNNIITNPLNMTNCYISQVISNSELFDLKLLWLFILFSILFAIISMGIFLVITLDQMITQPVIKIQKKMLRVANGDFKRDFTIEWDHELGDIGRGINDLSENVSHLLNTRLEDEKQKKDLEYRMLQNQINPHFIYNTLNSIKWMATIQGADGIAEMTISLSRLLKSISKGTSTLISIDNELRLVEDYFTIQRYRYGGTISLDIVIDDEKIRSSKIVKFTLQPLVENSIFHGIEPKGCEGHIKIHAYFDTSNPSLSCPNVRIDIIDDGVGIPPNKLKQIFSKTKTLNTDFFEEIGIQNVHQRLQHEFGDNYGLSISSVENIETTMSINIPYNI